MDAVLFIAVAWALIGATGRQWGLAGVASVAAVLLKPQVALPLAPFILVLAWPDGQALRRTLAGQLLALVVLAGGPLALQPEWPMHWAQGLLLFSKTLPADQPDPAELMGLARVLPTLRLPTLGFSDPLTWAMAGLAVLVMTAWAWWLVRTSKEGPLAWRDRVGWGVGLPLVWWALASPYIHSDDILVLAPVVLLLLAPDWWGTSGRRVWLLCLALEMLPDSYLLMTGSVDGPWVLTSLGTLWLAFASGREVWYRILGRRRDRTQAKLQPAVDVAGGQVEASTGGHQE